MSSTRHEDDFDPAGTPTRFYAVCMTPHSGSALLSRCLRLTGLMGAPQDYFNLSGPVFRLQKVFMCDSIRHYTDELLRRRTSPNGVFGMNLSYRHWGVFKHSGRYQSFEGLRLIHLRRKDRIAQAVSHRIAAQIRRPSANEETASEPRYDFAGLAESMNEITSQERGWAEMFADLKISPLRLSYEELVADTDRHVGDICRFVGVDPGEPAFPSGEMPPLPETPPVAAEWIERFKADLARLRDRPESKRAPGE